MQNKINYVLIILGAFIAIYAKAVSNQNQFILIAGIVVLMIGVYRISKHIPSKSYKDNETNNFNNE